MTGNLKENSLHVGVLVILAALFFVVSDIPEVDAFRRRLGGLAGEGAGPDTFGHLDLILPIAGSDAAFTGWWPVVVDRGVDCQAPVGR